MRLNSKSTTGQAKSKLNLTPPCPAAMEGGLFRRAMAGGSTLLFTTWMICTWHVQDLCEFHIMSVVGVAPG